MFTYIGLALQVKLFLAGVEKSLEKLSGLGSISLGQSFETAVARLALCEGIVLGGVLPTSELLIPAYVYNRMWMPTFSIPSTTSVDIKIFQSAKSTDTV